MLPGFPSGLSMEYVLRASRSPVSTYPYAWLESRIQYYCTVVTGFETSLATFSATLPTTSRASPVRPWFPMTT